MTTQIREYGSLYLWGKKQLEEAGVPDGGQDARLLLEYVCHTDRNTLLAHGDRPVSKEEKENYTKLIEMRATRIPLQYLTEETEFMGLSFVVNDKVLIPRQDTEILVEEVMRSLKDGMKILDMCTGSGCILISLLHYSNECEGVGVDLSAQALEVAGENAARLLQNQSICLIQSDLFDRVEGTFDVIVSNPPYIQSNVIEELMPEVRDHEPRMALDGRIDGLYFYRKIIEQSRDHLLRGGRIYFEIGYDQGQEVSTLLEKAGFSDVSVIKDYAGLDRVVSGIFQG